MSFLHIEAWGKLPPVRRQQDDASQALAAGVFQINTALSGDPSSNTQREEFSKDL
jgi:hypothetical protein